MIDEKMDEIKRNNIGVLIFEDDKVLLVRYRAGATIARGIWGLPAGGIKEGESAKEAAIRELKEETGLNASIESLEEFEGNYVIDNIERKEFTQKEDFQVFLCNKYQGKLTKSAETHPEWTEVSNIHELVLMPNVKRIVLKGWEYLKNKQ